MTSGTTNQAPPARSAAPDPGVHPDGSRWLTPAQAVERSGFSLDTLRYYERVGLLGTVERSRTGHRRFTPDDLEWLGVLRCLRDTGMPIAGMRRFAELVRAGDGTFAARLALLERHDVQVEEQIAHLRRQQELIHGKIAFYRSATGSSTTGPSTTGPSAADSPTADPSTTEARTAGV